MRNITVESLHNIPVENQAVELVERKGVGHPAPILRYQLFGPGRCSLSLVSHFFLRRTDVFCCHHYKPILDNYRAGFP